MDIQEYITCAAIWFDDGVTHPNQPVPTGVVLGGFSHDRIMRAVKAIQANTTIKEQGFLTSTGRFLDRHLAAEVAILAGQVTKVRPMGLDSSDLMPPPAPSHDQPEYVSQAIARLESCFSKDVLTKILQNMGTALAQFPEYAIHGACVCVVLVPPLETNTARTPVILNAVDGWSIGGLTHVAEALRDATAKVHRALQQLDEPIN